MVSSRVVPFAALSIFASSIASAQGTVLHATVADLKTILLVWTVSAVAILALATKRGWRANRWLILALILGPIGVAAALHLEQRQAVATTQERAFAQYRALAIVGGILFILCSPFFLLYSVWVTGGMILLGLLAIIAPGTARP